MACGGAPAPPPPARPVATVAKAEPARRPPPEPAPATDPLQLLQPNRIVVGIDRPPPRPAELAQRKSDYWSPCVRAFVQTQPAAARELLGEALSSYGSACTPERIELHVPRAAAPLALAGVLTGGRCELALRVSYKGTPMHGERIVLIADGTWWRSPRLEFVRDDAGEVAALALTTALVRELRRALDAHETTLRVEGARGYDDIVVGEELRLELRAMLETLDAISCP